MEREDLIRATFNCEDASRILAIPLRARVQQDRRIWGFSPNGQYTVRSAYHVLMERVIDNFHLRVPGDWMRLWRIKAPHKMKLMLWRTLRGCLPTRCTLFRCGVDCPTICPQCEQVSENDWHVFFGCNKAIPCWSEAGLWQGLRGILQGATYFNDAVFKVLEICSSQQQAEFVTMMWCLWRRRNDKLWRGEEKTPTIAINLARGSLMDWLCARNNSSATPPVAANHDTRWVKPSQGEFKCNIDVAIFNDQGLFGIGVCIRDGNGVFVRAKSLWMKGVPPAQEAEAVGLLEAINGECELGFLSMSIELDCKPVVDGVVGDIVYNSEFGTILDYCKEALHHLSNYRISFIRRQANQVAHSLTRASRNYASSQVFDLISTYMLEHFLIDMS